MAKRCPNCKNEISRYQEFCYHCGTEIKRVSKRPKHDWNILWKYFIIGMILPPLGYIWFFFFSRDHYDESRSAFFGAIAVSIISFVFYRIVFWLGWFEPVTELILFF